MCIIAIKPPGDDIAKRMNWLDNCWVKNPDGAGMAFYENGAIRYVKGFMTWVALSDYVKTNAAVLSKRQVAFHFRTATHGTVSPANTHPFPITRKQGRLVRRDGHTQCAFMHNGVLTGLTDPRKPDSDSLVFVRDYLSRFRGDVTCPAVQKLLVALGGFNRFAFMAVAEGGSRVNMVGDFVSDNGWWFSNRDYKYTRVVTIYPSHTGKPYGGSAVLPPVTMSAIALPVPRTMPLARLVQTGDCMICSGPVYIDREVCYTCDREGHYDPDHVL